jgi:uncharacterized repeat protein (TIGR01451 family)
MNAGREVWRKMLLAAAVLAAGSWLAPSLSAQTAVDPTAGGRAQKPSIKTAQVRSPLPAEKEKAVAKLGQVPMYFEENRGQSDSRVKFLSRGRGYTVHLTQSEAVLALKKKSTVDSSQPTAGKKQSVVSSQPSAREQKSADETAVLRMRLAGASDTARIFGEEPLPGKIYYASGKTKGQLPGYTIYQRVKYAQVYPGIDLAYYGNEGRLEFDFLVAPHADPRCIRLSFAGAERITLTKEGELVLRVSGEEVRLKKPRIYQERDGRRVEIAGGYALTGKGQREAVFALGPYDPSLPLIIDPQFDFATYLGGTGNDQVTEVRVLPTGEIYVMGSTEPGTGFPTTQTIPPAGLMQTDCFVSKFSPDGSTLLYSVIFPTTQGNSMAVGLRGRVHLSLFEWGVGSFLRTLQEDPTTGALILTPLNGAFDFNLGSAYQMEADALGSVYMVIYYQPVTATQPEYALFRVDSIGRLMGTITLLVPGIGYPAEQVTGLAVDNFGRAYLIGGVQVPGRITPTPDAFQPNQPGPCPQTAPTWCDGFVMEINTSNFNNFVITYASYLGGSGFDYMGGIAVGPNRTLYITGQTGSLNFPITPGPNFQPLPSICAPALCAQGFVVKLWLGQSGQAQLIYGGPLFPTTLSNGGTSIVALPGGLAAVFSNQSGPFTGVDPLYTSINGGPSVIVLSPDGSSLAFASHLQPDNSYNNWMPRMTSNGSGKLYIAGYTEDPRLGLTGAYQEVLAGRYDGLVRSISGLPTNSPPVVDLGPPINVSQLQFTLDCGNTLPCKISDPEGDALDMFHWIGAYVDGMNPFAPEVLTISLNPGANKIHLLVTDHEGAIGVGTLTINVADTGAPMVNPPPDLQTNSTEPGGARGSASPALHNFLLGATATDLVDPNPVALLPQADFGDGLGLRDVDDNTLFPLGFWPVTFRFQDAAGNIGAAVASVTITTNQMPSVFLGVSRVPPPSPPGVYTVVATSPAGATVQILAQAFDPENDPLTFTWSGSLAGLTLSQFPGQEQMFGVLPIGAHNIRVDVSDGHAGFASATVTINVLGVNTTGPQTVGLFDDNWQHSMYTSYWSGNPQLSGYLVTLTFANVLTPGLSHFRSRSDLNPGPPVLMQAGSPPYYYDIGTTAGYTGNIEVCVTTTGMSFANPGAIQLYQVQGGNWTALTSSLTSSSQICGSTLSLSSGPFAIFYPQVPETAISTIAGNGFQLFGIDGPGGNPRDDDVASGPATSIPLSWPSKAVFDPVRKYLYFSEAAPRIRRLDLTTGILTTVVGNGEYPGFIDGPGGDPRDDVLENVDPLLTPAFPHSMELALDGAGNLYYRDQVNMTECRVRKVDFSTNKVNTVAGNGICGYSGDGGPALQASVSWGPGLAVDFFGNVFLSESDQDRIRRVDALTGIITTVAGNGTRNAPTLGAPASQSALRGGGIAFDAQGHLLVAIAYNGVLRIAPGLDSQIKGDADEFLSLVVGDPAVLSFGGIGSAHLLPFGGDGGPAIPSNMIGDQMVVANDGALILNDSIFNRIRRVSPGPDGIVNGGPGETITTIAGYSYVFSGTGIFNGAAFATEATLGFIHYALEDEQGRIIIIDQGNNRIRRFGLSPFLGAVRPGDRPPVANAGPDQAVLATSAAGATVTLDGSASFDPDPGQLLLFTWSGPFGTLSGQLISPTLAVGTHTITLTVEDGMGGTSSDTVVVTVNPSAAVSLSPQPTASPDPVDTGSDLTYTVNMRNNGPSDATGVILDYPLPASVNFVSVSPSQGCTTPTVGSSGLVSCNLGTLAAGALATLTIVVKPTAVGPLDADFTLSSNEHDPTKVDNFRTVTVTVQQGPAVITVTEQITMTDSATPLPSAMIPVTENITVTDTATPLPSAMIPVTENITVTDTPAFTVQPSADLALFGGSISPLSVAVGQPVTITVNVINNGPDPATGATFRWLNYIPANFIVTSATSTQGSCPGPYFTSPLQCDLGTLASGQSATVTVVALPTQLVFPPGSTIPSTSVAVDVSASAAELDPDTTNNTVSPSPTFDVLNPADISITVTGSPDPVILGGDVTWSLTITNNGPADAIDVGLLQYQLLAGSGSASSSQGICSLFINSGTGATIECDLGTLAAGASATVTIVEPSGFFWLSLPTNWTRTFTAGSGRPFSNRRTPDPNMGNNSATATVTLIETTPPVVTPPLDITIAATEAGGARGNVPHSLDSQALAVFLAGGTATDRWDPNPVRLQPDVYPCGAPKNFAPADNTTLFPVGQSCVSFGFTDASGNTGTAVAHVTVNPPIGGQANSSGVPITPTDTNNSPMPATVTFAGVTQPGLVTAIPVFAPPPSPSGFRFGWSVLDISTTALYTPPITVCFTGSGFTASNRLLHYENGAWVDVTTSITSTQVCGQVNFLSPFGVVTPLNNAPTASAGANQIVEATSAAGAGVTLTGSGSDPDSDALSFAWSGPCGAALTAVATLACPLGTSTMTLTVDDGRGGSASASVQITVQDTSPPVLALPGNITTTATSSAGAVVSYTATANDLVDGAVPVSCAPASGSTFAVGTTTVNCSASDSRGNTANGSFTVTVNPLQTGPPRLYGRVLAKGRDASNNFYVDVEFSNTGTGIANNVQISSVTLRTLSGTGTVTVNTALTGALPYSMGALNVGDKVVKRIYLNLPSTVTRFSITEGGTLQDAAGTSSNFSLAQSVIP